jgi:hypothetical protein
MLDVLQTPMDPDSVWAAQVAPDTFVVCLLPQGPESAAQRMPALHFRALRDTGFVHELLERSAELYRESRGDPEVARLLEVQMAQLRRRIETGRGAPERVP